ncbi:MAG TPA: NUDIX domain-containing protein [Candidatus Saccharimonadales bacterium]
MTKSIISIDAAKVDKLFYVVANVIILNTKNATCLLLKRSEREKVHPGKWAFPGGKLEHGDVESLLAESGKAPIDGIDNIMGKLAMREAKEECGLDVDCDSSNVVSNKLFVRPDGIPVFMAVLTTSILMAKLHLKKGPLRTIYG